MLASLIPEGRAGRIFFWTLISAAALKGLIYWGVAVAGHPGEPLSVLSLYRSGEGDIHYFPQVAAMAEWSLGESNIYEHAGEGVRSFPILSVLPLALPLSLFGVSGLILADVCIAVVYFLLVACVMRLLQIPRWLGLVTSLLLTYHMQDMLNASPLGKFSQLVMWSDRLPRPQITELFFVLVLIALVGILMRRPFDTRLRFWVLLGAGGAALIQGDLHFAMTLAMLAATVVAVLLAANWRSWQLLLPRVAAAGGAFVVMMLPFIVQRLKEHPDIPQRFGVFPVPRLPLIIAPMGIAPVAVSLLVLSATAVVLWRWGTGASEAPAKTTPKAGDSAASGDAAGLGDAAVPSAGDRPWLRILAMLAGGCVLAFGMLTISAFLLGKVVQPYHFPDRTAKMCSYSLLIAGLFLLTHIWEHWLPAARRERLAANRALQGFAVVLLLGCCVGWAVHRSQGHSARSTSVRVRQSAWGDRAGYRQDFVDLVKELQTPAYADLKVIGTLEPQLYIWWSVYGGRRSFLVDNFGSTRGNVESDTRLAAFLKTVGCDQTEMANLLNSFYVQWIWFGHNRYVSTSAYTFAPLEDYTPEQQADIASRTIYATWDMEMPPSEVARMQALLAKSPGIDDRRLDLIVLATGEVAQGLEPRGADWALTYRNDTFMVWRHVDANASPAADPAR